MPILYVFTYRDPEEATRFRTLFSGSSSAIFTSNAPSPSDSSPAGTPDRGLATSIWAQAGGDRRRLRRREGMEAAANPASTPEGLHASPDMLHQLLGKLELAQGIRFE